MAGNNRTTHPITYRMRLCKLCGKQFQPSGSKHLYCSIMCRLWRKISVSGKDKCWEWRGSVTNKGYGRIHYKPTGRQDLWEAHRIAWQVVNGEIPEGLHVLHRCDNPPCCNPDHLFLGTNRDNTADRHNKGRSRGPEGTRQWQARLDPESVKIIRDSSASPRDLAARFGVTKANIHRVRCRKTWKYIK